MDFYVQNNLTTQPTPAAIEAWRLRQNSVRKTTEALLLGGTALAAAPVFAAMAPEMLAWALANPYAATEAGVIVAEEAAAIVSGAVTVASSVYNGVSDAVKKVGRVSGALVADSAGAGKAVVGADTPPKVDGPKAPGANSSNGNLLPETIPPRGFKDAEQYTQSIGELSDILKRHGIDDASVRIRGTSTTGFSKNPNKPGKFFDDNPDKPSDIDLAIESEQLSDRLLGAGQKPSKNIGGLYLPGKVSKGDPALAKDLKIWEDKWTSTLGREIEPAVNDPRLVKPELTDITTKLGDN